MLDRPYNNPLLGALLGLVDRMRSNRASICLRDTDRLDGKTCLITGANRGLGRAVALELARRGARLVLACRSGVGEIADEIFRQTGSDAVDVLPVDLSDLVSVHQLCDQLKELAAPLDVVILNAGVVPRRARRTAQGFELMFGVNYLANFVLVERLLGDSVLPIRSSKDSLPKPSIPRIVIVSSEVHRSARTIDFDRLGDYVEYGTMGNQAQQAHTKLLLCTLASELSRRLRDQSGVAVSVHSLCPGPTRTDIAREAPFWLKTFLVPMMRLFFRSPAASAVPVVYLACSRELEGETGRYLYWTSERAPAPEAVDPEKGRRLWDGTRALLDRLGGSVRGGQ